MAYKDIMYTSTANMFCNVIIIRKNVHTWNTPSSLKWSVRTICWSRSSAADKGFFWIPSPGRRHTGAATSRESGVPQHILESHKTLKVCIWLHWGRDCPGVAEIVKTEPSSQTTWPLTKWQWQYEYEWQLKYYLILLLFVLLLILVYYSILFSSWRRRGGRRRRKRRRSRREKQRKTRNPRQLLSKQLLDRNQAPRAPLRFVTAENIVELFRKPLPWTWRNVAVNLEFVVTVTQSQLSALPILQRQHWGMMCPGTLTCSRLTQITTTTGPKRIWLVFTLRSSVEFSSWCWILLISCNRWKDLACPADGWHLQTACMFLTTFSQCLLGSDSSWNSEVVAVDFNPDLPLHEAKAVRHQSFNVWWQLLVDLVLVHNLPTCQKHQCWGILQWQSGMALSIP